MGTRWPPRIATPSGASGGSGPAPPNTSVQFNDGGIFGGDATFEFDKVGKVVLEPNIVVTRSIIESGVISPPQITATQNDYAPANFATASVARVSTDVARAITGLAGGVAGRRVEFLNIGTQPLILSNENTSSVAANRFAIGADSVIPPGGSAILWYDGVSSRWRVLALQQVKTGGQIDLYVAGDAAAAIDTGPGTIAVPLKTIDEAIRRCNAFETISALFAIHVAPAPVAGYALTAVLMQHAMRGNIVMIADGAGQGTDAFTQLLASTAAVAGSSNVQVVTAAGLGVNTFRGKTIEILSGAALGDRRTIRDHTDTTIIPSRNFSAAVAATDTFRIVQPATVVNINTTGQEQFLQNCGVGANAAQYSSTDPDTSDPTTFDPATIFINFRFVPSAAQAWYFQASTFVLYGCEIAGAGTIGGSLQGPGSSLFMGTQWPGGNGLAPVAIQFPTSTQPAPTTTTWSGWGCYFSNGVSLVANLSGGFWVSGDLVNARTVVVSGETIVWLGGSSGTINGLSSLTLSIQTLTVRVQVGAFLAIAPQVALSNTVGTNAALDLGSGGNAVSQASVYLRRCVLTAPVLLRAVGAVNVTIFVNTNVSGTGTVLGIDASAGAAISLQGASGLLGPAGADLSVDGNVTSIAQATLAATGQALTNMLTLSTIRRIS